MLCQDNEYDNFNDNTCISCIQYCEKCNGDQCLKCIYGGNLSSQECFNENQQCPLGQFLEQDAKSCIECTIPFCEICSSFSICLKCKDQFSLTQDSRCIWNDFVSNEKEQKNKLSQLKMTISQNEDINLSYSCPLLSVENSSTRICEKIIKAQETRNNFQDFIRGRILQIEYYYEQNQVIVISQWTVYLLSREDLKPFKQILQISENSISGEIQDQIQHGIVYKNIIKVFSQFQIYIIDLNSFQIIDILDFQQDSYEFQINKRYFIDQSLKQLTYLFIKTNSSQLYLALFNITSDMDANNQIINYSINLNKQILIDIQESKLLQVIYLPQKKQIFITCQQKIYLVFLQQLNSNSDYSQYKISNYFDQPSTSILDQCEFNSEGVIYIIRTLSISFYLSKVSYSNDILKVEYAINLPSYEIQNNLKGSFQLERINDQSSNLLLVYLFTIKPTQDVISQNLLIADVEYFFENQAGVKQTSFVIPFSDLGTDEATSEQLLVSYQNDKYVILYGRYQIFIIKLDFSSQKILITKVFLQNYQLEMKINKIKVLNNTESHQYIEVIVPFQKTIKSYKINSQTISSVVSQQNYFENKNELFYLPNSINNSINDQYTYYDSENQVITFVEVNQYQKTYFIYQYAIETSQFIGFGTIPMRMSYEWKSINSYYMRAEGQYLYIFSINNLYCIQYYSLQVTYYMQYQYLIITKLNYLLIRTGQYDSVTKLYEYYLIQLSPNGILTDTNKLNIKFQYQVSSNSIYCGLSVIYDQQISTALLFFPTLQSSTTKQIIIFQNLNERYRLSIGNILFTNFLTENIFVVMQQITTTKRYKLTKYSMTNQQSGLQVSVLTDYDFSDTLGHQTYDKYLKQKIYIPDYTTNSLKLIVSYIQYTSGTSTITTIEVYDMYRMKTIGNLSPLENIYPSNIYLLNLISFTFFSSQNTLIFFYNIFDPTSSKYYYSRTLLFNFDYTNNTFLQQGQIYSSFSDYSGIDQVDKVGQFIQIQSQYIPQIINAFMNSFFQVYLILDYNLNSFKGQYLPNTNSLVIAKQNNFLYIQNIPEPSNLKQISFSYEIPLSSWYFSEGLDILICIRRFVKSQGQADIIQRIEFLSLDIFELIFDPLEFEEKSQIFWFEELKILIVCRENQVLQFKIINGKQQQQSIHKSEDVQVNFYSNQYRCIVSKLNPFLICQNYGIINLASNSLIKEASINLSNNQNIEENQQFIIFGEKMLFTIASNKIESINSSFILNISSLKLSQSVNNQGFYSVQLNECIIFQLPQFEIIYKFTGQSQNSKGVEQCHFDQQTSIIAVYSLGNIKSYLLPIQRLKDQFQNNISIDITSDQYQYFSSLSQVKSNKYFGWAQLDNQVTIKGREALIIDLLTGDSQLINSFMNFYKPPTIIDYWLEKQLLFTDIGIITLQDIRMVLGLSGKTSDQSLVRNSIYKFNKNYNYIIYESEDLLRINVLDVSNLFPINEKNQNIRSSFNIINQNIFYRINLNNQQQIFQASLIYFSLEFFQLMEQTFQIQISQDQQNINSLISEDMLMNMSSIFHDDQNYSQAPSQVIEISKIDDIYGLIFRCNLIVIKQKTIINQMSLQNNRCQIYSNVSYKTGLSRIKRNIEAELNQSSIDQHYIIENDNSISQLQIQDKQVTFSKIITQQLNANDKIINFKYHKKLDTNQQQVQFYFIIYHLQRNKVSIIQIKGSVKGEFSLTLESPRDVHCVQIIENSLTNSQNQIILLIGTQSQLVVYLINHSQDIPQIIESTIFDMLNRGIIQNIYILQQYQLNQSQSTLVANIIVTSRYRLSLFELVSKDVKQLSMNLNLLRENLLHSRKGYSLQVFDDNNIISVYSRFQVMLYSVSLKLIARIENDLFTYIRNVQLSTDGYTIFVTDLESISLYDLRKYNSKDNNLILQKSYSFQVPYIHQIIESGSLFSQALSEKYFIVIGQHLYGMLNFKYFPSQDIQSNDMIDIIKMPIELNSQKAYYSSILTQDDQFLTSNTKMIYFSLQGNCTILIPINLLGFDYQKLKRKLNIQIDLNGYQGELIHYNLDIDNSFVSSLIISNGTLILQQNLNFQGLSKFILQKVNISLNQQGFQLIVNLANQIIFDQILIKQEIIKSNQTNNESIQMQVDPLIVITKSNYITVSDIKIGNSYIQKDIFYFSNCTDVLINKVSIISSEIFGAFAIFAIQNENIIVKTISILNSKLLQCLSVQNSSNILVQNLNLISLKQIVIKNLRRLQQIVSSQNSFINDYSSLIKIEYILNSAVIQNIQITTQCQFNIFLSYSNQYTIEIEEQKAGSSQKQQIVLTKISENSSLTINEMNIKDCEFNNGLMIINENQININGVKVEHSQNPSIQIYNAAKLLDIIIFEYQSNTFNTLPLIEISNSIINFNEMKFLNNRAISQIQIDTISLLQSVYLINNLFANNNTNFNNFILLSGDYQGANQVINTQQNIISNIQISNCTYSAIQIENKKLVQIIQGDLINNSISKLNPKGGAIKLLNIEQCIFSRVIIQKNYAILSGGGIYMEDSNLKLHDSQISYNEALIGGGLRYNNTSDERLTYLSSQSVKDQISNNIAHIFGNNIASYPSKIKVVSDLTQVVSSLNQMVTQIVFEIYGEDGEIAQLDIETLVQKKYPRYVIEEVNQYLRFQLLSENNQILLQGQKSQSQYDPIKKQFTIFFNAIDSGYDKILQISQNKSIQEIDNYHYKQVPKILKLSYIPWKKSTDISIDIDLYFRECQEGEQIQKIENNYYQCYQCNDNTYLLGNPYTNILTAQCQQCPLGSVFCQGNLIIPQEEYWVDPGTDFIAFCNNLPYKCTQKYSPFANLKGSNVNIYQVASLSLNNTIGCIEGGIGPKCESCDYNGEVWNGIQFGKINRFECIDCQIESQNVGFYLFSLLLISVFMIGLYFSIYWNMIKKINKMKQIYLYNLSMITINSSHYNYERNIFVLKILLQYIQTIGVIYHLPLYVNDYLIKLFLFVGDFLNIGYYLLDCFFAKSKLSSYIQVVYLRLIWTFIQPLIAIILLILIIRKLNKNVAVKKRIQNLQKSSLIVFYLLVYPSLINQTLGVIICKKINQEYYVLTDSQFQCFGIQYFVFNILLNLPLLAFSLLLPLYFLSQIKQNKIEKVNTFLNYGILYSEYNNKYYYWETVKVYHKIFIYFMVNIFNNYHTISGVMVILSIIYYMKYQQKFKPYVLSYFNQLDQHSQITSIFTIFGLLVYIDTQYYVLRYLIITFVIFFNCIFLIKIVCSLQLPNINIKLFQYIQLRLDRISRKYPQIFENNKPKANNILRLTQNWKKLQHNFKSFKLLEPSRLQVNNSPFLICSEDNLLSSQRGGGLNTETQINNVNIQLMQFSHPVSGHFNDQQVLISQQSVSNKLNSIESDLFSKKETSQEIKEEYSGQMSENVFEKNINRPINFQVMKKYLQNNQITKQSQFFKDSVSQQLLNKMNTIENPRSLFSQENETLFSQPELQSNIQEEQEIENLEKIKQNINQVRETLQIQKFK